MFRFLLPNHMVELLREERVPPVVQFLLISLIIAIQCLLGRPGLVGPLASSSSMPFAVFQLCMVLVTLWLSYKANGAASGRDFLTRYAMLACVLFLWVHAIGYLIYLGAYFALFALLGSPTLELFRLYGPAQLAFTAITSLALLLALQHYITKVATGSAT